MKKNINCFTRILDFTIYSLILCLLFNNASAQEVLDKLKKQYEHIPASDPSRLPIANKYIAALYFHQHENKASEILQDNLQIAVRQGDGKYAANLYAIAAMNDRLSDRLVESNNHLKNAKRYASKSKDIEIKGYVYYCEGWILTRDNREGEAVRSFINALTYLDKAPPSATLNTRKSSIYKELTSIYANWKEYKLQEKYSFLALDLAVKQNDPIAIFDAQMLMGYMYEQQYLSHQDDKDIRNKAEKYYLQAIHTYKKYRRDIPFPSNLSFVAINLAHLYTSYYPDSYQDTALYYAELAQKQAIATNQYTHIASANGIMADIALKNNDADRAKDHLLNALSEVSKASVTDQNIVLNIYQSLSEIAENEGNINETLRYYKAYMDTFQIIYDQDQLELGKRLEAQFDKERQRQQLLNMQLEADKKEQQLSLMHTISLQQQQKYENLRLQEENQRKQLALSELESEKHSQELKLSRLETESRSQDIVNYQNEISFKERINKYYISLIVVFVLLLLLLLYAYKQHSTRLRQNKQLYQATLDQERQKAKISTLTAMVDGQELERGRMARDLHDGLGGLLSSTKISLTALNGDNQDAIQKSIDQLDTAVEELRKVAHNLMPDLLYKYGLQEALQDYAVRMSHDQLDIDVQFFQYKGELKKEKQLIVYRIIQELVNNAVKHALAHQIIIQFVEEMENYAITVEDDGLGFDEAVKKNSSAGLLNIQTRIEFLKGNFRIQSQKDVGTSVEILFPKNNI